MAIKVISPEIKKQYLDGNGDPYSGGQLYVYEAGTTTLVETYTDEGGLTPNANPIILNSNGEIGGLYLSDGSYKFRLDDADDVTIWTVDNVTARDFGQEIDDINDEIDAIDIQLTEEVDPNNVKSGKASTKSLRARYLIPDGSSDEATILATATDLVFVVDSVENTLDVDTVISGLTPAPSTNNTALINDALLSDQDYTKQLGSLGSFLIIDGVGSEISALVNKIAAFKIGSEYFTARIDDSETFLKDIRRGNFYDENNAAIEPDVITDGDLITLMKLGYVFLKTDFTTLVTYNEPVYSTTEPVGPATGDMWFNLTTKKWLRYSSTAYIDATCAYLGMVITDSSSNTVGARPADFYAEFDDENTFDMEGVESSVTQVKSKSENNKINVYGNALKFLNNSVIWDIATDLDSGESEVASIDVYEYIKENGDIVMSLLSPYNNLGDLLGYYHPYEAWRYVGKVYNDSASDFEVFTALESAERVTRGVRLKYVNTNVDYRCSAEDDLIIVDTKFGDITVYLCPPEMKPGKKVLIKKRDTIDRNKLTVDTGFSVSTIILSDFLACAEFVSGGDNDNFRWNVTNYPSPEKIIFKDEKAQNTEAGASTNTYTKRTLNVTEGQGVFASITDSVINIIPGVYGVVIYAPGYHCDSHKAKLYDEDNSADKAIGSSEVSSVNDPTTWSKVVTTFEITVETNFTVQHIAGTPTAVSGFGVAGNLDKEVYTQVEITKLR